MDRSVRVNIYLTNPTNGFRKQSAPKMVGIVAFWVRYQHSWRRRRSCAGESREPEKDRALVAPRPALSLGLYKDWSSHLPGCFWPLLLGYAHTTDAPVLSIRLLDKRTRSCDALEATVEFHREVNSCGSEEIRLSSWDFVSLSRRCAGPHGAGYIKKNKEPLKTEQESWSWAEGSVLGREHFVSAHDEKLKDQSECSVS